VGACLERPVTASSSRFEYTQVHMGMPVRLALYAPDPEAGRAAAAGAFSRVAMLDDILSDYRDESELRRLQARSGEWVPVSSELFAVLSRAIDMARMSDGAFDPTIGPLVTLWRRARTLQRLPEPPALERARQLVGWRAVRLDSARSAVHVARPGIQLDLGGIAKGFVAQQALDSLREDGVTSALIEAGGDIVVSDAPPGRSGWHIDVPGAAPAFAARASRLKHAALATSGSTAQFVEIDGVRYSHIIDPRTGLGVTSGILASVIATDAMVADALATTLTIVPARRDVLLEHFPDAAASLQPEPKSASSPPGVSIRYR
jgi:thiamine biosynthesis lipoprotein